VICVLRKGTIFSKDSLVTRFPNSVKKADGPFVRENLTLPRRGSKIRLIVPGTPWREARHFKSLPESVVEHGVNFAVTYGFVREFKRAALAHLAGGAQEGSEGGTR